MATIEYTARRSLLPDHAEGELVVIDLDLEEQTSPSRVVQKNTVRSSGGRIETIYHGADTVWQISIAPIRGHDLDVVREFLRSTSAGESFRIWLYGDEAEPLTLRRVDDGYSREPFMRVGSVQDWWKPSAIRAFEE